MMRLVKTYRTVQEWDRWLTETLGGYLLSAEKDYLSQALAERYGKHILLIGVPHQQELIQCSVMSNQVLLTSLINRHKNNKCIESDYYNLPIAPGSVDLVLLPHTLELLDNPRQLLLEACRAVKPEGLLITLGFNPISFWGFKKWIAKESYPKGSFIHSHQVKNWLKLADFELVKQDMLLFRPPITNHLLYSKLLFLEWIGKKCYSPLGGVYVLVARAKTIPLIPIKLHWKQKLSALQATLPGQTMRDIQHSKRSHEKSHDIY